MKIRLQLIRPGSSVLRTEFENYKKEMADKINEAAAQNLSLQDQIDDLQEQLKHVAKAQHASVPKASVQNAEPAATTSVPHFNIATPKASDAQAAKGSDEPIHELKTPAVLAQEAKAKLDELLKGGRRLKVRPSVPSTRKGNEATS